MAMWVMAVAAVAPCQGLWLGGRQMTSAARISTISSHAYWVQPQPAYIVAPFADIVVGDDWR
jgi:hypothetical protein